MGCVVERASAACERKVEVRRKKVHGSQSWRILSIALHSMKVAKLSFSHRSSHHFMVTRSPNHWWAISWAMTSPAP